MMVVPHVISRHHRRRHDAERGQMAGIEAVPFGLLTVVLATLLATTLWSTISHRDVVDAAARNYLRSYTASPDAATAATRGARAAHHTADARGVDPAMLTIFAPRSPFGPCRQVEVTISMELAALKLPFVGRFGTSTVTSTQRELIQPFGGATAAEPTDPFRGTPCDD